MLRGVPLLTCYTASRASQSLRREDPRLEKRVKRCESCRPMGVFRLNKDEFLLCYDGTSLTMKGLRSEGSNVHCRIWAIRRQTRTKSPYGHNRTGGNSRVRRLAPAMHPSFDSRFIEIHHVETSHLVQVMALWTGRLSGT